MAHKGPLPKSDKDRIRGGKGPLAVPQGPEVTTIPPPPKGIKQEVKDLWDRLWMTPVGRMWDPDMDGPLLERYARTLHHWHNAQRDMTQLRGVVVDGSQGQPVLHPLTTYITQLQNELAKMENQLGLSPMARARLGLTIAEGQLTAAQLSDMVKSKHSKE